MAGSSGSTGSANVGSGLCLDFTCGFAPSWLALFIPFMTTSSPAAVVGSAGVAVGLIDGEGCTDGSDCTDDSDCTGDSDCTDTGSVRVAGIVLPVLLVPADAMVPIVSSLMVTDSEWRPCGSCEGAPAFSDGTGSAGV